MTLPTPGNGGYAQLIEKDHDPWTYDVVLTFYDIEPDALRELRDDLERMGWIAQAEELAELIAGEEWAGPNPPAGDEASRNYDAARAAAVAAAVTAAANPNTLQAHAIAVRILDELTNNSGAFRVSVARLAVGRARASIRTPGGITATRTEKVTR